MLLLRNASTLLSLGSISSLNEIIHIIFINIYISAIINAKIIRLIIAGISEVILFVVMKTTGAMICRYIFWGVRKIASVLPRTTLKASGINFLGLEMFLLR